MSLFLGKHNNKPLLHSTRNEQSEEQLTKGPNKDTIFHSDLPYILEKERFLIQCKPRWFRNSARYVGSWSRVRIYVSSELRGSRINGYEGEVPERVRRLKSLGYLYVIVLHGTDGSKYTQFPHLMFTGTGSASTDEYLGKPFPGSIGTSTCAGNSLHTITFSENRMNGGDSSETAYDYGTRGREYTNSPYPCVDVESSVKSIRVDRYMKKIKCDFTTAKHDHMLSPSSNYVQIWQLDGGMNSGGSFTKPATDYIADKVEIIFFNTRISEGKIHIDNSEIRNPNIPNGVYVDNKNLYLNQVNLVKNKMLTFWDQPVSYYKNVDILSTHPGSDEPVKNPNSTIFISGSRGISSGCKLPSCQVQVGGKFKGSSSYWYDGWCVGGPAPAATQIHSAGGSSVIRDKLTYTYTTYPGLNKWRKEKKVYTDKDSYGYYRNIKQDYFGIVDLGKTYIEEGLEIDSDNIKLKPKDSEVYSDILNARSKPTYIVGELVNLSSPPQTAANYKVPQQSVSSTSMIKLGEVEAGFYGDNNPALGLIKLIPGEKNYIAKSKIKRYGRHGNFNLVSPPDSFRVTRGLSGINGMSGVFNFVEGKYYHVVSWWAGYSYHTLGNAIVRCNIYLKREGSKLCMYYKLHGGGRRGWDVTASLHNIKLPGIEFNMAKITI